MSGASGSASRRRWNCRNANTIAAFVGRTEWKRWPATTTASGRSLQHAVDGEAERVRDVGLALIDARGGLSVILPDTEVRIGDVRQFNLRNVSPRSD
jgi:hypothetical protein